MTRTLDTSWAVTLPPILGLSGLEERLNCAQDSKNNNVGLGGSSGQTLARQT